jgi:RNA polymerase sigma factor (sigma-70 family)
MTPGRASAVLRHLHELSSRPPGAADDRQLLERFTAGRDEAAFAALVRRHGPMVLGVCRRVLHNAHDAEDAFQATFLVLARKAGSIRGRESIGGWLYRVGYHMALKAREQAAARQKREARAARPEETDPLAEVTGRELLAVFDEELQTLPDRERVALVLCYLQGRTGDEAAREVGCSESTLKRRLERGKGRLRARLARRGLALPAAILAAGLASGAKAAVPGPLAAAAVKAGLLTAAGRAVTGVISIRAAALAGAALRAMALSKVKTVGAFLIAIALLGAGTALLASSPPAAAPPAAAEQLPMPPPASAKVASEDAPKMTVSGRVLDPDGRPVAGADVTVCALQGQMLSSRQMWASYRNEVFGRTKSDQDGGYRLTVPRPDPLLNLRSVHVVAAAAGHGLTWGSLDPNPDTDRAEAELKLSPVQRVAGRLVGLQGEAAAGVTVHVAKITRKPEKGERWDNSVLEPPEDLHLAATTDARGNFALGGFGPGLKLELAIRDPPYECEDVTADTGDKKQCENLRVALNAGRCVEGRVVYGDTGRPVPHARLLFANPVVEGSADEQGRFKVALPRPLNDVNGPARDAGAHAFPHPGEPYLNAVVGIDFPRGVVRRQVEVKLPRGVLLRGKVTEAGSGKSVAGAYVTHAGLSQTYAVSGPDGSYRLGVPAGTGYLLVTHPSCAYVPQILGSLGGGMNNPGGGSAEKPAGDRCYFHAIARVTAKAGEDGKEVNVSLRRGVTLTGRAVGPDDKPVAHAVLFVSGPYRPRAENTMQPVDVWNGRFVLHGLDPEKTYRLLVLDHPQEANPGMTIEEIESFGQLMMRQLLGPENKHGATVEVVPQQVNGELTVKLAPCGSARVRFVDGDGKPLAKFSPWLQLVVTPGPTMHQALQDKVLAAEVVTLTEPSGGGQPGDLATDDKGYVRLEGLVPGATYRLKKTIHEVIKEFTAEAGKTLELTVTAK